MPRHPRGLESGDARNHPRAQPNFLAGKNRKNLIDDINQTLQQTYPSSGGHTASRSIKSSNNGPRAPNKHQSPSSGPSRNPLPQSAFQSRFHGRNSQNQGFVPHKHSPPIAETRPGISPAPLSTRASEWARQAKINSGDYEREETESGRETITDVHRRDRTIDFVDDQANRHAVVSEEETPNRAVPSTQETPPAKHRTEAEELDMSPEEYRMNLAQLRELLYPHIVKLVASTQAWIEYISFIDEGLDQPPKANWALLKCLERLELPEEKFDYGIGLTETKKLDKRIANFAAQTQDRVEYLLREKHFSSISLWDHYPSTPEQASSYVATNSLPKMKGKLPPTQDYLKTENPTQKPTEMTTIEQLELFLKNPTQGAPEVTTTELIEKELQELVKTIPAAEHPEVTTTEPIKDESHEFLRTIPAAEHLEMTTTELLKKELQELVKTIPAAEHPGANIGETTKTPDTTWMISSKAKANATEKPAKTTISSANAEANSAWVASKENSPAITPIDAMSSNTTSATTYHFGTGFRYGKPEFGKPWTPAAFTFSMGSQLNQTDDKEDGNGKGPTVKSNIAAADRVEKTNEENNSPAPSSSTLDIRDEQAVEKEKEEEKARHKARESNFIPTPSRFIFVDRKRLISVDKQAGEKTLNSSGSAKAESMANAVAKPLPSKLIAILNFGLWQKERDACRGTFYKHSKTNEESSIRPRGWNSVEERVAQQQWRIRNEKGQTYYMHLITKARVYNISEVPLELGKALQLN